MTTTPLTPAQIEWLTQWFADRRGEIHAEVKQMMADALSPLQAQVDALQAQVATIQEALTVLDGAALLGRRSGPAFAGRGWEAGVRRGGRTQDRRGIRLPSSPGPPSVRGSPSGRNGASAEMPEGPQLRGHRFGGRNGLRPGRVWRTRKETGVSAGRIAAESGMRRCKNHRGMRPLGYLAGAVAAGWLRLESVDRSPARRASTRGRSLAGDRTIQHGSLRRQGTGGAPTISLTASPTSCARLFSTPTSILRATGRAR